MSKPVLIVGGGPAGLAAAHSLATVGKDCVIVEKEDRLGGAPILSGYAKLVPTGEWAKDAIGGMVKRVEDEGGVKVVTGATVTKCDGAPGSFTASLSNGESVEAEAVILCTGFTQFDSSFTDGTGSITMEVFAPFQVLDPLNPNTEEDPLGGVVVVEVTLKRLSINDDGN